jgi:hypothetical protein
MRKKAERKIREAAAEIGSPAIYPIDRVRRGAGLIPKVFDKTLLDMARVKTIELEAGNTEGLSPGDISAMVRSGDTVYTGFRFFGPVQDPELAPETVDVALAGFEHEAWQRFLYLSSLEGKTPEEKLQEMILEFNQKNSGPLIS